MGSGLTPNLPNFSGLPDQAIFRLSFGRIDRFGLPGGEKTAGARTTSSSAYKIDSRWYDNDR